jgi:hypothetical protein
MHLPGPAPHANVRTSWEIGDLTDVDRSCLEGMQVIEGDES